MKASILMSHFNKNECLPNTLHSISKQKASFPFEVCIVDDGSKVDPGPVIKKFLPYAKYQRYDHIGFEKILSKGFTTLIDPQSEIVIIQSCDIVYTQPFIVEELCKNLKPHSIAMAEVKCLPIKLDMYKNFDVEINNYLTNWNNIKGAYYSGSKRPPNKGYIDYIFFLAAMFKKDLYKYVRYDVCDCDCVVNYNIKYHKIIPIFLDNLKGIHQLHKRNKYPGCSLLKTCNISCRRKGKKGNIGKLRL